MRVSAPFEPVAGERLVDYLMRLHAVVAPEVDHLRFLAQVTGVPRANAHFVLTGEVNDFSYPIKCALALEAYFDRPAEFWMTLWSNQALARERAKQAEA